MSAGEKCETFLSKRDSVKLFKSSYSYCSTRNQDLNYFWRCDFYTKNHCKARVKTILKNNEHYLSDNAGLHSHEPDPTNLLVSVAKNIIKEKAIASTESPSVILQQIISKLSSTIAPELPSRHAMRQVVKRARRSAYINPSFVCDRFGNSQKVSSFAIQVHSIIYLVILLLFYRFRFLEEELFLFCDVIEKNYRILLFAVPPHIQILADAKYFIVDGTFDIVPTLFQQFISFHAPLKHSKKIVLLVYAILTSKEILYDRMFHEVKKYATTLGCRINPEYVISDFEVAIINSVRKNFPESMQKGCHFHLSQSIFRHIQQSPAIFKRYAEDNNFNIQLRSLSALAFLPSNEIPAAFDMLVTAVGDFAKEVTQWFAEYYVHGRQLKRNNRPYRKIAQFPPMMVEGMPRTQNAVEAWHRRINQLAGASHIQIFKLIELLMKETKTIEFNIRRDEQGFTVTSPKK